MMKTISTRIILGLGALLMSVPAPAQSPIEGLWRNPSGTAIIAIAPCGAVLCGKVVWASERGQREVAAHAPKVVGTTVLTNVKPRGGRWSGTLYIPDDNITVSARLQSLGPRQLKLTGCIIGIFCRSQVWARVDRLPA
jgi:uncharacterized protein (DUF2147 family)